jgi:hypothetical protein
MASKLPFETIQPTPRRDPHYLPRPTMIWAVDTPAARKIREFTDDAGSGWQGGTRCKTPGHFISSTRWGYLSFGCINEIEAYEMAAANLPELPIEGENYIAGGKAYRMVASHPITGDLYFSGEAEATWPKFWVTLETYKDHFERVGA